VVLIDIFGNKILIGDDLMVNVVGFILFQSIIRKRNYKIIRQC